ncbi:unnamed protein product [Calypogeia fissa]
MANSEDSVTPRLISLCTKANGLEELLLLFRMLNKNVQRGLPNLDGARSFAGRYFDKYTEQWASASYSALGTPGGRGRDAFCEITKTRRVFDIAVDEWRKERETVKRLKVELGGLRSAVSETNAHSVTTLPNASGQPDSKRPRLDTEETNMRDTSRIIEVITLSP